MKTRFASTPKVFSWIVVIMVIAGGALGCSETGSGDPDTSVSGGEGSTGSGTPDDAIKIPVDVYSTHNDPFFGTSYVLVIVDEAVFTAFSVNEYAYLSGKVARDGGLYATDDYRPGSRVGSLNNFRYECTYDTDDPRGDQAAMRDACGVTISTLGDSESDGAPTTVSEEPQEAPATREVEDMTGDAVQEPAPNSPPEGRITPVIEDEARQAVEDYYDAVNDDDWAYTYSHLHSETQSMFTEDEWSRRNQWFEEVSPTTLEVSSVVVHNSYDEPYADVERTLILEESNTESLTETRFVYEDGEWVQHLSGDILDQFMPGASFEEFVRANGG